MARRMPRFPFLLLKSSNDGICHGACRQEHDAARFRNRGSEQGVEGVFSIHLIEIGLEKAKNGEIVVAIAIQIAAEGLFIRRETTEVR